MKKKIIFLMMLGVLLSGTYVQAMQVIQRCEKREDIVKLFPKDPERIKELVIQFTKEAQKKIDEIISMKKEERTFDTTALALDRVSCFSNLSIFNSCISAVKKLSPDQEVRDIAKEELLNLSKFWIEQVYNNKKLYEAIQEYEAISEDENLTNMQKRFLKETIEDYKKSGLGLPEEELEEVKEVEKKLSDLTSQFGTNIATDNRTITVKQEDLAGLDKEFVGSLKKDSEDNCILGMDYPTVLTVLDYCKNEETRKKLYIAFRNRAYPDNKKILQEIMEARDELAQLLGFESYAHLDLDDKMAKSRGNQRTSKI